MQEHLSVEMIRTKQLSPHAASKFEPRVDHARRDTYPDQYNAFHTPVAVEEKGRQGFYEIEKLLMNS